LYHIWHNNAEDSPLGMMMETIAGDKKKKKTCTHNNEGTTMSHSEGMMRDPPHAYKHLLIGGLTIVVKYSI
jgi:hypothetical protein